MPSLRRLTLAFAVLPIALGAQTVPGITFKICTQLKTPPNPDKAKPDSVRIKRLEAAAAARANDDVGGGGSGDAPPVARPAQAAQSCRTPSGGANNVLMMNGAFVKGYGRMDVKGVIGCPELTATQVAV